MLVIKDFATTTLASALTAVATTITVANGSKFPALAVGDYFYVVLQDFYDRNLVEVVKVTGVSGNVLTVVRGQDGTVGRAFAVGAYAELRLTVRTFAEFIAQSNVGNLAWGVATASVVAQPNKGYLVNAAGLTITLPNAPVSGQTVGIGDYNSSNHAVTIARNGSNIMGRAENFIFNLENANVVFVYIDATFGWMLSQGFGESQAPYAVFNKLHRTNVSGQKTFPFASTAANTVDVYYNGWKLDPASDYTTTTTEVTLLTPVSSADDVIEIYGWNQALVLNASGITYDNAATGLPAGTMQQAVDKVHDYSFEAIRRSYAEAGYTLRPVPESFGNGGTLTSAKDVLLHAASGKAYSGAGPFPQTVGAGTNPESGFTDRSDALLLKVWLDEARNFNTFGATGLGLVPDDVALQVAIDWAGAKEGRRVYGDSGAEYLINTGLISKYDGKSGFDLSSSCVLDFTGTKLVPNSNDMFGLAISRNHATVIRPTVHNKLNKTNITAYIIGPYLLDAETKLSSSRWSEWTRPVGIGCAHGFIFQPGPSVSGEHSGCFYHTLYSPFFIKTGVGFWFKSNITHDVKPTRIHIYSPRQHSGNCMFDIENAESLRVYAGTADHVNEAGKYPNKPTIRIAKQAADSVDNGLIAFYDFVGEAGGIPYELDGALFKNVFANARFINYATPMGTISATSNPSAQIWGNEGPIYSIRENADRAMARLGVRHILTASEVSAGGKVGGEAYLEWEPNAATYPARLRTGGKGFEIDAVGLSLLVGATGMKVSGGPVTRMDLQDGRNLTSNLQRLGTDSCHVQISGTATDNDFRFYNVNAGATGNGFVFGGADLKYLSTYDRTNYTSLGRPSFIWSVVYAGTGTIQPSDEREKTAPLPIDDAVLDAWGDVQLIVFKWLEAVRQKGEDGARWHFGVIAQQVRDTFIAHELDGCDYALLCYDEWGDVYEPIMAEREAAGIRQVENTETGELEEVTYTYTETYDTGEVKQTQVAGNRWGIRSDQCLFLEAAWNRREVRRQKELNQLMLARLEALEAVCR